MDKLHIYRTQILASLNEELKLDRLLEVADKIHENNNRDNTLYYTSESPPDKSDRLSRIEEKITELTFHFQSMTKEKKIAVFTLVFMIKIAFSHNVKLDGGSPESNVTGRYVGVCINLERH